MNAWNMQYSYDQVKITTTATYDMQLLTEDETKVVKMIRQSKVLKPGSLGVYAVTWLFKPYSRIYRFIRKAVNMQTVIMEKKGVR